MATTNPGDVSRALAGALGAAHAVTTAVKKAATEVYATPPVNPAPPAGASEPATGAGPGAGGAAK